MPGIIIISIVLGLFFFVQNEQFFVAQSRPYRSQQNASEESEDFASGMANLFRQTSALSSLMAFDLFGVTHTQDMKHGDMPVSKSFCKFHIFVTLT